MSTHKSLLKTLESKLPQAERKTTKGINDVDNDTDDLVRLVQELRVNLLDVISFITGSGSDLGDAPLVRDADIGEIDSNGQSTKSGKVMSYLDSLAIRTDVNRLINSLAVIDDQTNASTIAEKLNQVTSWMNSFDDNEGIMRPATTTSNGMMSKEQVSMLEKVDQSLFGFYWASGGIGRYRDFTGGGTLYPIDPTSGKRFTTAEINTDPVHRSNFSIYSGTVKNFSSMGFLEVLVNPTSFGISGHNVGIFQNHVHRSGSGVGDYSGFQTVTVKNNDRTETYRRVPKVDGSTVSWDDWKRDFSFADKVADADILKSDQDDKFIAPTQVLKMLQNFGIGKQDNVYSTKDPDTILDTAIYHVEGSSFDTPPNGNNPVALIVASRENYSFQIALSLGGNLDFKYRTLSKSGSTISIVEWNTIFGKHNIAQLADVNNPNDRTVLSPIAGMKLMSRFGLGDPSDFLTSLTDESLMRQNRFFPYKGTSPDSPDGSHNSHMMAMTTNDGGTKTTRILSVDINGVHVNTLSDAGSLLGWKKLAFTTDTVSNASNLAGKNSSYYLSGKKYEVENITVGGDPDKYYPVLVYGDTGQRSLQRYNVFRRGESTAPDIWEVDGKKPSLDYCFQWDSSGDWNDLDPRVIPERLTYTGLNTIGGTLVTTDGIVIWLRGGNTLYNLYGPMGKQHSIKTDPADWNDRRGGEFEARAKRVYDINIPADLAALNTLRKETITDKIYRKVEDVDGKDLVTLYSKGREVYTDRDLDNIALTILGASGVKKDILFDVNTEAEFFARLTELNVWNTGFWSARATRPSSSFPLFDIKDHENTYTIPVEGCIIEVFGKSLSQGMIRITTPTNSFNSSNGIFIYNGAWRKEGTRFRKMIPKYTGAVAGEKILRVNMPASGNFSLRLLTDHGTKFFYCNLDVEVNSNGSSNDSSIGVKVKIAQSSNFIYGVRVYRDGTMKIRYSHRNNWLLEGDLENYASLADEAAITDRVFTDSRSASVTYVSSGVRDELSQYTDINDISWDYGPEQIVHNETAAISARDMIDVYLNAFNPTGIGGRVTINIPQLPTPLLVGEAPQGELVEFYLDNSRVTITQASTAEGEVYNTYRIETGLKPYKFNHPNGSIVHKFNSIPFTGRISVYEISDRDYRLRIVGAETQLLGPVHRLSQMDSSPGFEKAIENLVFERYSARTSGVPITNRHRMMLNVADSLFVFAEGTIQINQHIRDHGNTEYFLRDRYQYEGSDPDLRYTKARKAADGLHFIGCTDSGVIFKGYWDNQDQFISKVDVGLEDPSNPGTIIKTPTLYNGDAIQYGAHWHIFATDPTIGGALYQDRYMCYVTNVSMSSNNDMVKKRIIFIDDSSNTERYITAAAFSPKLGVTVLGTSSGSDSSRATGLYFLTNDIEDDELFFKTGINATYNESRFGSVVNDVIWSDHYESFFAIIGDRNSGSTANEVMFRGMYQSKDGKHWYRVAGSYPRKKVGSVLGVAEYNYHSPTRMQDLGKHILVEFEEVAVDNTGTNPLGVVRGTTDRSEIYVYKDGAIQHIDSTYNKQLFYSTAIDALTMTQVGSTSLQHTQKTP